MLNVVDVVIAQLRAALEARNCSDAEPPAKRVVVKRTSALDGVAVAPLGGASSIQTLSPLGIVGVGTSPSVEHAVTLSWVLSVAPHDALIDDVTVDPTGFVDTVNVAVFVPSGTITLGGTAATMFDAERRTTAPPAGAFAPRVMVPLTEVPPCVVDEERTSVAIRFAAGTTVSVAFFDAPNEAVRVTFVVAAGVPVVTETCAAVTPGGTVMFAGSGSVVESEDVNTTVAQPL